MGLTELGSDAWEASFKPTLEDWDEGLNDMVDLVVESGTQEAAVREICHRLSGNVNLTIRDDNYEATDVDLKIIQIMPPTNAKPTTPDNLDSSDEAGDEVGDEEMWFRA